MSTNSYILKENKNGTYTGIYCHWDGYFEKNGVLLVKYYKDRKKVEKLISLGTLNRLERNIDPNPALEHSYSNPQKDVCFFLKRDWGRDDWDEDPTTYSKEDLKELIEFGNYVYVYTLENKWVYLDFEDNNRFFDLEDKIIQLIKEGRI